MIKKQAWCFAVLFVLLIAAKWPEIHREDNRMDTQKHESGLLAHSPEFTSLRFADEHLPLGDFSIEEKMMEYLDGYSYGELRSYHIHEQAVKFLPQVDKILRSYGIPADFKYIPLIESGFTGDATSHKGASGYWQFMPETARAYGLTVDEELDERQDLIKSTHAVAKYLQALYKEFDSWTLVAAAYNVGSGSLQKAIDRQGEDNYFRLKLNKETGSFVYKLISVKEIIENPARHGYSRMSRMLAQAGSPAENSNRL